MGQDGNFFETQKHTEFEGDEKIIQGNLQLKRGGYKDKGQLKSNKNFSDGLAPQDRES